MSSKATDKAKTDAKKFFAEGLVTDATTKAWIASGNVPIVTGSDSEFGSGEDSEWLKFVYDLASKALLPAVLGPGALADGRGGVAGEHREALRALLHAGGVRQGDGRDRRVLTGSSRTQRRPSWTAGG